VRVACRQPGDLRVEVADDWIVTTTPVAAPAGSWWPLLAFNAALDGAARIAGDGQGGLAVRGEIAIDVAAAPDLVEPVVTADLDERVAHLCADVERAAGTLAGREVVSVTVAAPESGDQEIDLANWCAEQGWIASAAGPDRSTVALDVPGGPFHATLAIEDSRLRATVALAPAVVTSAHSRDAIALLLLDATADLRTVKGVVVRQDDADLPGLAIAAERRRPGQAAVDRALTALAVAAATVGREVQALQDASLAREYLSVRAWRGRERAGSVHIVPEEEETPCLQQP
jgi:hypothetical protein